MAWVCEKLEPNPERSLECALMRTALEHLQQMARFPLMLNVAPKRREFQNAAAAKLALAMDSVLPAFARGGSNALVKRTFRVRPLR